MLKEAAVYVSSDRGRFFQTGIAASQGHMMHNLFKWCPLIPPSSLVTLWNGCTKPFNYSNS